jgi:1-deoxy-D-xylulose-5-phosphate synthase
LQRAYDQIIHDVCLQNLPVVFCLDRAGLVGKDGKTHQGTFDLSYLTHIPKMNVFAPNTVEELGDILEYALMLNAPVAIRYPKNAVCAEFKSIKEGLWRRVKNGDKVTLVAVGPKMLELAESVSEKFDGVGVVSARSVKPLCSKTLDEIKNTTIITLEENAVIGGFSSLVSLYYAQNGGGAKVVPVGVKDAFVKHGRVENQMKENDLTEEYLYDLIKREI